MGDMPGAGEIPETAGLMAVAGVPRGEAPGGGGGGVWPKEVHTSVTEQRLTSSSVFIGLIGKFFPARFSDEALFILNELSASRAKLSRMSFRRFGGATKLVRIIILRGM